MSYSKFFLTLLENREKNIIQKNPFVRSSEDNSLEPFFELYNYYYRQKINHLALID